MICYLGQQRLSGSMEQQRLQKKLITNVFDMTLISMYRTS